jgi:hypothetical protein
MADTPFHRLIRDVFPGAVLRRDALKGLLGGGVAVTLGGLGTVGTEAKQKKPKTCKPGKDACDLPTFKKFKKAKCGPKGTSCFCVTGTSATICGSFPDGECNATDDVCQTDEDCVAITGPGSVCTRLSTDGTCTCGAEAVQGFTACLPPCTPPGTAETSTSGVNGPRQTGRGPH